MTKYIELSKSGKNKGKFLALIDDSDFELVNRYRWSVAHTFNGQIYAVRFENRKTIYMHRFILGLDNCSPIIDHIDGNGLNNTRNNLRESTPRENRLNTYKNRGVSSQSFSFTEKKYQQPQKRILTSMDIPSIVKHYRGSESLRAFASKLGVSHAAVQQWENGDTEPRDELIDAFARSSDSNIREMGKALFVARHGSTLKTLLK